MTKTINIEKMNRELQNLLGFSNFDMGEKDRWYPSVGIDDHRKIGYFTQRKMDKLQENNWEWIENKYGSSSYFNSGIRKDYGMIVKAGKFFKYFYPDFDNEQIRDLVQKWYSIIGENESLFNFEITDRIAEYYHYSKYYTDRGNLGNSCMKHTNCSDYLNFYKYYNTELLILKNEDGKISGRAIIWKNVYFPKIMKTLNFMERIYVNDENDQQRFIDYAKKENMVYKLRQSYSIKRDFIYDDLEFRDDITIIPLKSYDIYDITYPFIDTVSYMNQDRVLSNSDNNDFNISLEYTDGRCSETEDTNYCEDCNERFNVENNGAYIDNHGYVCQSCLDENYFFCDDCNEWAYHEDSIEIIRENTYNITVCRSCAEYSYFQCDDCSEWFESEGIMNTDYDTLCTDCYDEKYTRCEFCSDNIKIDDSLEFEGDTYCPDCYGNKVSECENCNEMILTDETFLGDDLEVFCSDCHNEYLEEQEEKKELELENQGEK